MNLHAFLIQFQTEFTEVEIKLFMKKSIIIHLFK